MCLDLRGFCSFQVFLRLYYMFCVQRLFIELFLFQVSCWVSRIQCGQVGMVLGFYCRAQFRYGVRVFMGLLEYFGWVGAYVRFGGYLRLVQRGQEKKYRSGCWGNQRILFIILFFYGRRDREDDFQLWLENEQLIIRGIEVGRVFQAAGIVCVKIKRLGRGERFGLSRLGEGRDGILFIGYSLFGFFG